VTAWQRPDSASNRNGELTNLANQAASLTAAAVSSGGTIVSTATPPTKASNPKLLLVLPSALLAGLLIGFILAFAVDRKAKRISSARELGRVDLSVLLSLTMKDLRPGPMVSARSAAGLEFAELARVNAAAFGWLILQSRFRGMSPEHYAPQCPGRRSWLHAVTAFRPPGSGCHRCQAGRVVVPPGGGRVPSAPGRPAQPERQAGEPGGLGDRQPDQAGPVRAGLSRVGRHGRVAEGNAQVSVGVAAAAAAGAVGAACGRQPIRPHRALQARASRPHRVLSLTVTTPAAALSHSHADPKLTVKHEL
jgi:hypothetical protein